MGACQTKRKTSRTGKVYSAELCCGTYCSQSRYFLQRNPRAMAVGFDIIDEDEWARRSQLPKHLRRRFVYVKFDCSSLTFEALQRLVWQYLHIPVEQLDSVWYSPPCETHSVSRDARTKEAQRDSRTHAPLSYKAKSHDAMLQTCLQCLWQVTKANPNVAISVENPTSDEFINNPFIQLTSKRQHWQLFERTNYCKNATCARDHLEGPWPYKPTSILAYGVSPDLQLPLCDHDCDFRLLHRPNMHAVVLRSTAQRDSAQTVQRDPAIKSRIPSGLLDRLWVSHQNWLETRGELAVRLMTFNSSTQIFPLVDSALTDSQAQSRLDAVASSAARSSQSTDTVQSTNSTPKQSRLLSKKLWHARLGHPSVSRTQRSARSMDGVSVNPHVNFDCRTCSSAKISSKPHTRPIKPSSFPLGRVHCDIQGPMETESADGFKYNVLFTDDYTRKHFGYLLKNKSDIHGALLRFLQDVGVPNTIRLDNAGEHLAIQQDDTFSNLCLRLHIRLEFTLPNSPAQNGVAERANRHIMEMTRALLISARLPIKYWSYAWRHAVYLTQFLVPRKLNKTPYELWFGKRPNVSHLRVWGSRVTYRHASQPGASAHTHLLPVGHRGVFLGFNVSPADEHPNGIEILDQDSVDSAVRRTADFDWSKFDEAFAINETRGIDNVDFCLHKHASILLEDEPPIPMSCDLDVRDPPPLGKTTLWQAYQEHLAARRLELCKAGLSAKQAEVEAIREWRTSVRDEAAARILRKHATRPCSHDSEAQSQSLQPDSPAVLESSPQKKPASGALGVIDEPFTVPAEVSQSMPHGNPVSASAKGMPAGNNCHRPDGLPDGEFEGEPCRTCGSAYFAANCKSYAPFEMILCDNNCGFGHHRVCIDLTPKCRGVMPRSSDTWFCRHCRQVGLRVEFYNKSEKLRQRGTLTEVQDEGASATVTTDAGQVVSFRFEQTQWSIVDHPDQTIVGTVGSIETMLNDREPRDYADAMILDKKAWSESMRDEWHSYHKNDVIAAVPRSEAQRLVKHSNAQILRTKWVYKIKSCGRRKSRLTILGNHQNTAKLNMDTACATPRLSTIRTLLSYGVQHNLGMNLLDVSTAFLNSALTDRDGKPVDLFIEPPQGYEDDSNGTVYRLLKSAYGLRSAPRDWSVLLHSWLLSNGFKRSNFDSCLFSRRHSDGRKEFIVCYVDDCLLVGADDLIAQTHADMAKVFVLTGGDPVSQYLGMTVHRDRAKGTLKLSIPNLAAKAVVTARVRDKTTTLCTPMIAARMSKRTHGITEAAHKKAVDLPYRRFVGQVNYMAVTCRPDLSFAVKELGRYNSVYNEDCWKLAQRVATYIKHTIDVGILYTRDSSMTDFAFEAYVDASYNDTPEERLSTCGFLITVGGNMVSYASRSQKSVSRSVGESETLALAAATAEVLYFRQFVRELTDKPEQMSVFGCNKALNVLGITEEIRVAPNDDSPPTVINSDSSVALSNARLPVSWCSDKLKHVQNSVFFWKTYHENRWIRFQFLRGSLQRADALTKGFDSLQDFIYRRSLLFCE